MDDYLQLNMNFMRAIQTGNADAALFFASEIEKKYPDNESVKQFKDILMKHSTKLAHERGISIPGTNAASVVEEEESESEDEDDNHSSNSGSDGNDDDDGASSGDEEEQGVPSPAREPTRPSSLPPSSKATRTPAASQQQQPSIRNLVTLNPNREIDDEVDRMFEDADRQIAEEMQRYAASRK
ncbi:Hypothetical protein, putative [Bodo saltans]|uniref:Uncharacterized protein n=1 Tax=Bodo saltans TaxID=75058 RepID=A0A0S4JKN9_BODSA|nr:Hypothetical protein, putative [Bodo saltans]|eukprot:CUG90783.1 Hypothetical protein, putative [Bodo saltans]